MINIDELLELLKDDIVIKAEFLNNVESSGTYELTIPISFNDCEDVTIEGDVDWSFVYLAPTWEEGPQELKDLEIGVNIYSIIIDTQLLYEAQITDLFSEEDIIKIKNRIIEKIIFEE